jgi:hypothetical protein
MSGTMRFVSTEWEQTDALLLECVGGLSPAGGDLGRVIGIADYIDRFVFKREEIEGGMQRLLGPALIEESELRFRLTPEGQALRDRAPQGPTFDRIAWFRSYLREGIRCTPTTEWTLTTEQFDAALASYQAEMRAAIDRMR